MRVNARPAVDHGDLTAGTTSEITQAALNCLSEGDYEGALAHGLVATQLAQGDLSTFRLVGAACLRLAEVHEDRHRLCVTYEPRLGRLAGQFYAHAVRYLSAAVRSGCSEAVVVAGLAQAHIRRGDIVQAHTLVPLFSSSSSFIGTDEERVEVASTLIDLGSSQGCAYLEPLVGRADLSGATAGKLAHLLIALGHASDAVAVCRRNNGGAAGALNAMTGLSLAHSGDLSGAIAELDHAIRAHPNKALYCALTSVYLMAAEPLNAIASADAGLTFDRTDAVLEFSKAHALLLLGRWLEAWPYWEARLRLSTSGTRSHWEATKVGRTTSFRGKTVWLTWEQGLGDTILFSRFAADLQEAGATVIIGCQPSVAGLIRRVRGVTAVTTLSRFAPDHDLHIPLLSVPRILGTKPDSVSGAPYITIEPRAIRRWAERLSPFDSQLRVGIVWHGNRRFGNDRQRSVGLKTLSSLASIPRVQLFSLQKGQPSPDDKATLSSMQVIDLGESLDDFIDTASVLQCLDLLISVDTSVAHLAGALGRSVWLLLPYSPAPLWMLDSSRTPLYAGVRIFRQSVPSAWTTVIDTVTAELTAMSYHHMSGHTSASPNRSL